MPFCTQCGDPVAAEARFCRGCGAAQAAGAPPAGHHAKGGGMNPRTASILCYLPALGWIASVFVLASQRFQTERAARFHAFQGLYLFVAWLIVDFGVGPFFEHGRMGRGLDLDGLMKAFLFGVGIFMMVKAAHNEMFHLPVVGELADRSLAEQR